MTFSISVLNERSFELWRFKGNRRLYICTLQLHLRTVNERDICWMKNTYRSKYLSKFPENFSLRTWNFFEFLRIYQKLFSVSFKHFSKLHSYFYIFFLSLKFFFFFFSFEKVIRRNFESEWILINIFIRHSWDGEKGGRKRCGGHGPFLQTHRPAYTTFDFSQPFSFFLSQSRRVSFNSTHSCL